MGEDACLLKKSLDQIIELLENKKIKFTKERKKDQEIISMQHHKITYTSYSGSAIIVCEDDNDAPISVRVIERPGADKKYRLCYMFPIERARKVKECLNSASSILGNILSRNAYGTNSMNVIESALGSSNVIVDVPQFLVEHIAYFEKNPV